MASSNFKKQGTIYSQSIGQIPIYGLESLPIKKVTNWEQLPPTPTAVQALTWKGDEPFSVQFNFKITAGMVPEAKDRQSLFKLMRYAQAMVSFVKNGQQAFPPPPCQLVIGQYINCKGVFRRFDVTPSRPWSSQDQMPTTCCFDADFIAAPTYNGQYSDLNDLVFDSASVASKYFKT